MTLSTDLPYLETEHRALAQRLEGLHIDDGNVVDSMAKAGLLGHLLPETGRPDVRSLCLIREALGQVSPLADAVFAVQGLGSFPLVLAGGHDALLAKFRAGTAVGAFALTETEAGSDVASMRTRATKDGDGYRLDGQKTLISNVGIATHYTVFANVDPGFARSGISAFLVSADAVTAEPFEVNVEHPIGDVGLAGSRGSLIGEEGQGFKLAMDTLGTFRVTVAAAAVGMARKALSDALSHTKQRVQFGKALADQPVVRSHLADMAVELDAARLLTYRAAAAIDGGQQDTHRVCAMAKLYATEAASRIIDMAVQLHGGMGVKKGVTVETLYRAIRPLRIYEGTSEIQRLIIGRDLVKNGAWT